MAIITQQTGAHNTPNDKFHQLSTPAHSPEKPQSPPDHKIPRAARELFNIIVEYMGDAGTPVRLLQSKLAQRLEVSDTTIRRYTSTLTKAGLIQARRGRNCVIYSLPTRTVPPHRVTPAHQPSTHPVTPTSLAKEPDTEPTLPTCPAHSIRRVSDMTQRTAHTVWHCTKRYRDRYCSWLYHQMLGTLQEPYRNELSEDQVLDIETRLLNRDETNPCQSVIQGAEPPPPTVTIASPDDEPTNTWQSTLHNLSQMIPDPAKAAIIIANTSLLEVVDDTIIVRVHQPRHLQWLTDPIHQSMANTAATQARSRLTTVKFVA